MRLEHDRARRTLKSHSLLPRCSQKRLMSAVDTVEVADREDGPPRGQRDVLGSVENEHLGACLQEKPSCLADGF
jgi:hypothetical protein